MTADNSVSPSGGYQSKGGTMSQKTRILRIIALVAAVAASLLPVAPTVSAATRGARAATTSATCTASAVMAQAPSGAVNMAIKSKGAPSSAVTAPSCTAQISGSWIGHSGALATASSGVATVSNGAWSAPVSTSSFKGTLKGTFQSVAPAGTGTGTGAGPSSSSLTWGISCEITWWPLHINCTIWQTSNA